VSRAPLRYCGARRGCGGGCGVMCAVSRFSSCRFLCAVPHPQGLLPCDVALTGDSLGLGSPALRVIASAILGSTQFA